MLPSPGPLSVDLRGSTVAYAWLHLTRSARCGPSDPTAGPRTASRVVLQPASGAAEVIESAGCDGDASALVSQARFAPDGLTYVFASQAPPVGQGVRRVGFDGGSAADFRLPDPDAVVLSYASANLSALATSGGRLARTTVSFAPLAFTPSER